MLKEEKTVHQLVAEDKVHNNLLYQNELALTR